MTGRRASTGTDPQADPAAAEPSTKAPAQPPVEPSAQPSTQPPTVVTESVPGYRDLAQIGHGGFSVVYRAVQESFERAVALKVLTVGPDEDARRRFLREVRLAGRLSAHPHVVTVLDTGTTGSGRPYLAMDLYDGGSMRDRLRRLGPLPAAETAAVGAKIAQALSAAHAVGVLHRDVKPNNILISRFGEPALADFGVSCLLDASSSASVLDVFTPQHAAPELMTRGELTAASDVYALGSTLYQLLTGQSPFGGNDRDVRSIMWRVVSEPPPRPHCPELPGLADAIVRAMAKEPQERFPDAAEFARTLAALVPDAARPLAPPLKPSGLVPAPAAAGQSASTTGSADPVTASSTATGTPAPAVTGAFATKTATELLAESFGEPGIGRSGTGLGGDGDATGERSGDTNTDTSTDTKSEMPGIDRTSEHGGDETGDHGGDETGEHGTDSTGEHGGDKTRASVIGFGEALEATSSDHTILRPDRAGGAVVAPASKGRFGRRGDAAQGASAQGASAQGDSAQAGSAQGVSDQGGSDQGDSDRPASRARRARKPVLILALIALLGVTAWVVMPSKGPVTGSRDAGSAPQQPLIAASPEGTTAARHSASPAPSAKPSPKHSSAVASASSAAGPAAAPSSGGAPAASASAGTGSLLSLPGSYRLLQNAQSGTCLAQPSAGSAVGLSGCAAGAAEGWQYSLSVSGLLAVGKYELVNKQTGLCLATASGGRILAQSCDGGTAQLWSAINASGSGKEFENAGDGQCLLAAQGVVSYGSCSTSNRADLWNDDGTA